MPGHGHRHGQKPQSQHKEETLTHTQQLARPENSTSNRQTSRPKGYRQERGDRGDRGGRRGRGDRPGFTHFASLPFIRVGHRSYISNVQDMAESILSKCCDIRRFRRASNLLMHLTLGMLSLPDKETKARAVELFQLTRGQFEQQLRHTKLTFSKCGYFSRWNRHSEQHEVSVIFLEPEKDQQLEKVKTVTHLVISKMLQAGIVKEKDFGPMHVTFCKKTERFELQAHHLTLYRVEGVPQNPDFEEGMRQIEGTLKPVQLQVDFLDISTRFQYDETRFYEPLVRVRVQSPDD